jgi:hypothetical protein
MHDRKNAKVLRSISAVAARLVAAAGNTRVPDLRRERSTCRPKMLEETVEEAINRIAIGVAESVHHGFNA